MGGGGRWGIGQCGQVLLKDEVLVFSAGDPRNEKHGGMLDVMKHSRMTAQRPISVRAAVFPGPEARGGERSPHQGSHGLHCPPHTQPVRITEGRAELGCCQDLVPCAS